MGYLLGLLRYILKSAYKNTYAMVVFGGSTLAILYLLANLSQGRTIQGVQAYVVTKYLPPLTVPAFVSVLVVGCVWAGLKWYSNVPRR